MIIINWAHVHLMINHVPVIGVPLAILLLFYGLAVKSEEIKKTSLGAFVLIALIAIPVYFTGEAAQDVIKNKNLPGVTESAIGRHEEAADLSITMMEILGVASFAGLYFGRRSGVVPKWMIAIVFVLSLATAVVVGYTANLGGQIRHTEIR